jgi:ferrous iron transport protein A
MRVTWDPEEHGKRRTTMFPMGLLADGEKAEVVDVPAAAAAGSEGAGAHAHRPGCRGCGGGWRTGTAGRMEDMGLRPGKIVEMLVNEGRGALLVKVDESRIAMGRAAAMKILVRRTES